MSELNNGERQVSNKWTDIRQDHRERYLFAANKISGSRKRVLDFACGVGYGAASLAAHGHEVTAIDKSEEAIQYGRQNWHNDNLTYVVGALDALQGMVSNSFDWVIGFEILEHLQDPVPYLRELRRLGKQFIFSVPNEEGFPHRGRIKFHFRHYTRGQFEDLLFENGFKITSKFAQLGTVSSPEAAWANNDRTLIAVCERDENWIAPYLKAASNVAIGEEALNMLSKNFPTVNEPELVKSTPTFDSSVPDLHDKHICILGLGGSLEAYVDHVKRLGGRKAFADEVWGINAVADVIHCDRVFHMDDIRVQEARAERLPNSNIANMVKWLKECTIPVYTSYIPEQDSGFGHWEYKSFIRYPLETVIKELRFPYFNSTAAYAIAFAICANVKQLSLFGMDFTYPNEHHAEQGRACVEFWLGQAAARGIEISMPESTTLLDFYETKGKSLYGYDGYEVAISLNEETGEPNVTFAPKELPTAEEIEARYNHAQHPNARVRKEM